MIGARAGFLVVAGVVLPALMVVANESTPGDSTDQLTSASCTGGAFPPRGLRNYDPWIDACGDRMYGNLVLGSHNIGFTGGQLGTLGGSLSFNEIPVCVQDDPHCQGPPGPPGSPGPQGDRGPAGILTKPLFMRRTAQSGTLPSDMLAAEDGLPTILTQSVGAGQAVYTIHCSDLACSNSVVTQVPLGQKGTHLRFALGPDGLPIVSFNNPDQEDLMIAKCNDTLCGSATVRVLDNTTDHFDGWYNSIAIGTDGLPLISYYDYNADGTDQRGALRVAHCNSSDCSNTTISELDSDGDTGQATSLGIGSDGLGVIAYYDVSNGDLKLAHCNNVACTNADINVVDSAGDVGPFPSLAIAANGFPMVAYANKTDAQHYPWADTHLKLARCLNMNCSLAVTRTVDVTGQAAFGSSLAVGADGLPVMLYYDYDSRSARFAHCVDLECSDNTALTLDQSSDVGQAAVVAIGVDGNPFSTYFDNTNLATIVVHCSNHFCTPYYRPR